MLKPKRKTDQDTADPLAPSPEFLEARARWGEIDTRHRELTERRDGLELAVSLARNPQNARRVPDAVKQRAHPYKKLAQRRRPKAIAELEDTIDALDEMAPAHGAASEAWHGVKQAETNRIACSLQGRQREAALAMATAVEALSRATAAERECRAELRRVAPLPESPNLPDLSRDLQIGTLADWGGIAWQWARRLRKLQILED